MRMVCLESQKHMKKRIGEGVRTRDQCFSVLQACDGLRSFGSVESDIAKEV